jgi:hypothetical protein
MDQDTYDTDRGGEENVSALPLSSISETWTLSSSESGSQMERTSLNFRGVRLSFLKPLYGVLLERL